MSSLTTLFGGGSDYTIRDQFVANQINNGCIVGQAIADKILFNPQPYLAGVMVNASLAIQFTANSIVYYTSPDLLTWTTRYASISTASTLLACCSSSVYLYITSTTTYCSSTDGINWTSRSLPVTIDNLYLTRFAYKNGVFCLFSYKDTPDGKYYTSTDGINWTQQTFPESVSFVGIIMEANGCLIISGGSLTKSYYSSNNASWTEITPSISGIQQIVYNSTTAKYTAIVSGNIVVFTSFSSAPNRVCFGTFSPICLYNDIIFLTRTRTEVASNTLYDLYKADIGGSMTDMLETSTTAILGTPTAFSRIEKFNNKLIFLGTTSTFVDLANLKEAVILK